MSTMYKTLLLSSIQGHRLIPQMENTLFTVMVKIMKMGAGQWFKPSERTTEMRYSHYSLSKFWKHGAEEMAQSVRALTALPSSHTNAHNCLELQGIF